MSYLSRKIGTVTVPAGQTRDKSYECAAWYTKLALTPGTYDLFGQFEVYGQYSGVKPEFVGTERMKWVTFTVPAVIIEDYFSALFCGNLIGNPYDKTQHAGQPDEYHCQLYPYQVADVILHGQGSQNLYQLDPDYQAIEVKFEPLGRPGTTETTYEIRKVGKS